MSSEQEIRNQRAREYYHRNKDEIKELIKGIVMFKYWPLFTN